MHLSFSRHQAPTKMPSQQPTTAPTAMPTGQPTERPSQQPTQQPTVRPTPVPTTSPTAAPTPIPFYIRRAGARVRPVLDGGQRGAWHGSHQLALISNCPAHPHRQCFEAGTLVPDDVWNTYPGIASGGSRSLIPGRPDAEQCWYYCSNYFEGLVPSYFNLRLLSDRPGYYRNECYCW